LKKILFFTLFSISLFAEATVYFGVDYGAYHENFTKNDAKAQVSSTIKAKLGYGLRKAYSVEINAEKTNNQHALIQNANSNNIDITQNSKLSVNVSLQKAFDPGIFVFPFFKAGFGAGKISVTATGKDLDGNDKDVTDLNFGSFNLGAGFLIPINESFDVEVGYDFRYQSYENLDASTTNNEKGPEFESKVNITYIGLNYRF